MKFFLTAIIILVLLCISIFIINSKDELSLNKNESGYFAEDIISNEWDKKLKHFFSSEKSQSNNPDSFQVYKWKGEKGVMHYSDQNSLRFKSKLTELDPIMIVPAYKAKSVDIQGPEESKKVSNLPGLTTIPISQIPKLIKDSQQVQTLMDERKDNMDKVIDLH